MFRRWVLLILFLFCLDASLCIAQSYDSLSSQQTDSLPTISLLTCGAGNNYYQLEGHSALRLQYPDGRDIVVNWGVFDFRKPNFAYRFVKGETDYSIGIEPMDLFMSGYVHSDRSVTQQILNLTPSEKENLIKLIDKNLLPQNRIYRYNYVKDNCATRPLDILENALTADSASILINEPQQNTTFREEMRKYHNQSPGYQFFIDYALGNGLDYTITPKEQAFAPIFLEKLAASAQIINNKGQSRPLVSETKILYQRTSSSYQEPFPNPLWFTIIIFVLAIYLNHRDQKRNKISIWFDGIYYSIIGILGSLLTFLVFFSSHEATSPNLNILWINPLCFIVPILIGIKTFRKILYIYQWINVILMIAFILCLPIFGQSTNPSIIFLLLTDFVRSENYITYYRKNNAR